MLNSAMNHRGSSLHEQLSGIDVLELCKGFTPAFRDLANNETHLSTHADGEYCTYHSFDNLPIDWVEEWDKSGYAVSLKPSVIAGFMRGNQFYTLFDLVNNRSDS
jgi:hypothetical protein